MTTKVCNCGQYCLRSMCQTSDSGLTVRKCWCAECRERRAEIRRNAYTIVAKNGGAE